VTATDPRRSLTIGIDARELQGRPTGVGRYLRNLIRVWTRTPGDRLVAYFNGAAPADPVLEAPGLVLRPLGGHAVRGLRWQQRLLPSAARNDSLDVFFAPAYSCPLGLEIPRVTTVHDLSFFSLPDDFTLADGARRRFLVEASVRESARVLAVSAFTAREIGTRFPDARGRVRHVPHGSDDDLPPAPERSEARRRLGVSGPLVVTVGTILNRRHLPILLRAFRKLPGATLDVVGENRTHPPLDLEAIVEGLGLRDRVRLVGFASEGSLADRYAAADAAVFLSEYEGFGLPALEAMARGVPVVVADRPALNEIFGEAALVVDPLDPAAIADAVQRILRDAALAGALRDRGRALAARHSWEQTAAATRSVLVEAAGR
jgi:glycosyltransferase involved in cell wall biosynthesis